MTDILDKRWKRLILVLAAISISQIGMEYQVAGQKRPSTSNSRGSEIKEAEELNAEAEKLIEQGNYNEAMLKATRALEIRKRVLGPEHPLTASALANIAYILFKQNDYKKARENYQQALDIVEKQKVESLDAANTLNNFALLYYTEGDRNAAERLFRRAVIMLEKIPQASEKTMTATIMNNLATILYENANYEEAGQLFQNVLSIQEKLLPKGNSEVLVTIANLGFARYYGGKYGEAVTVFNRALDIIDKNFKDDPPEGLPFLSYLLMLYIQDENYDKAESIARRTLTLLEKNAGNNLLYIATAYSSLGQFYKVKGDYTEAETLFNKSLAICKQSSGEEHPHTAAVINNLGLLYYSEGDLDRAEPLLEQGLKIREKVLPPGHPDIAVSLSNLARCYMDGGKFEKAATILQRALTIFQQSRGEDDPTVAQTLNDLGLVRYFHNELIEAERLYLRAWTIYEKKFGAESFKLVPTLNNLGLLYQSRNDLNKAEQFYRRALAIFEKLRITAHPILATVLENLASLSNVKSDITRAVELASRAAEMGEKMLDLRLAKGSEKQKQAYWRSYRLSTMMYVSLHLRDAPNNKAAATLALTTILRRKGRVLDAMVESMSALRNRSSQADKDLLNRLAAIRAELNALMSEKPEETSADYSSKLAAKLEEYQRLQASISSKSAELITQSQPITIESIQKQIPDDAALVELVCYKPYNAKTNNAAEKWGMRRYGAYVLHRNGEFTWADLGEAQPIDYTVWNMRIALRNPSSRPDGKTAQDLARELYKQVMRPLSKALGSNTKQLFISPDSTLHLIPFEAFMDDGGRYLIQRYSFTYLSSGRDLQRLQFTAASRQPSVIVANPDFDKSTNEASASSQNSTGASSQAPARSGATFASLAGTEEEAIQIAKLFRESRVLVGAEATETALKQLHGPSILHIATHGFFPMTQAASVGLEGTKINGEEAFKPSIALLRLEFDIDKSAEKYIYSLTQSGLALAGANNRGKADGDDGILTAFEASGLDLWGTKLVVLSACETGLGDIGESGNGVDGLRRSLVLAGAESQVISLWKVNNEATRDIMVSFYTKLRAGMSKSEALRQVKLDMLRRNNHPYYWASFIQSGDWRSINVMSN